MHVQFPQPAIQDFRDVVTAMVPFVRHGGVTIVANDDGVFVTALTQNVDLKFRIPGASAISTGNVTVSIFDLRDVLKNRAIKSAKHSQLLLAVVGKKHVDLSIAASSWQIDRKVE
jgi:hypothetical protein